MTTEETAALDAMVSFRITDLRPASEGYSEELGSFRTARENLIASRRPKAADVFVLALGGVALCDQEVHQDCFRKVAYCLCRQAINEGLKAVREMTK